MKDISEFKTINDFFTEIEFTTLNDEIELWQYYSPIQIFRYRFKKALLLKNEQIVKNYEIKVIDNVLNEYILENLCFDEINNFEKISFTSFSFNEKRELEKINSNDFHEKQQNSFKKYYNFLKNNTYNFYRIDILKKDNNNLFSSFVALIQDKINPALIKPNKIETTFNAMLTSVDNNYLFQLLNFDNSENTTIPQKEIYRNFDFDYYKDPILLQEFEEEKTIYLKFFKSFINETLYKRKEILRLEKMPLLYQHIQDYSNTLIQKKEVKKIETAKNSLTNIEYPKHIFQTANDYKLFLELISVSTNNTQVSFFYRTMAEKEKPPKILVKDTPFRDWFNSQEFHIKLNNHTKTLINSENEDRKAMYKIAKYLLSDSSKINE